jgi:hypothetical protein
MLGFRTIGCPTGVTLFRNVGTPPQSANRVILPVYIRWERSMRSEDWRNGGAPSASSKIARLSAGERPAGTNTSPGCRFGLGKPRSPIIAALPWLAAAFLEGCAACAQSMHPGLPDPSHYSDHRDLEIKKRCQANLPGSRATEGRSFPSAACSGCGRGFVADEKPS